MYSGMPYGRRMSRIRRKGEGPAADKAARVFRLWTGCGGEWTRGGEFLPVRSLVVIARAGSLDVMNRVIAGRTDGRITVELGCLTRDRVTDMWWLVTDF